MGYEFFGEKIIFPSAPVPGINNDQSLKQILHAVAIFKILQISKHFSAHSLLDLDTAFQSNPAVLKLKNEIETGKKNFS